MPLLGPQKQESSSLLLPLDCGMIRENGIETCTISYMKRIASPGSMHDTGCTLGRPRGMVWGGRREEGSGWGTHVPVVDSF